MFARLSSPPASSPTGWPEPHSEGAAASPKPADRRRGKAQRSAASAMSGPPAPVLSAADDAAVQCTNDDATASKLCGVGLL